MRCSGSTSDASWPRRCLPNGYSCPRAAPRPGTRSCSRPPTRHCPKENRRRNPWTLAWDLLTSEYLTRMYLPRTYRKAQNRSRRYFRFRSFILPLVFYSKIFSYYYYYLFFYYYYTFRSHIIFEQL